MRDIRLGDDIDDFCVRCKRVMNHAVVSVINAGPAKVRCRTCHSDHDYRHEQAPPPKVDSRKAAAYNEMLKKVSPDGAAAEVEVPELEEAAEVEVEAEGEIAEAVAAEAEAAIAEAEAPPAVVEVAEEEAVKSKAKVKAKGKGKK